MHDNINGFMCAGRLCNKNKPAANKNARNAVESQTSEYRNHILPGSKIAIDPDHDQDHTVN